MIEVEDEEADEVVSAAEVVAVDEVAASLPADVVEEDEAEVTEAGSAAVGGVETEVEGAEEGERRGDEVRAVDVVEGGVVLGRRREEEQR